MVKAPVPAALIAAAAVVVLLCSFQAAFSLSIGVNYGALADNLPPPAQVAAFLKENTFIDRVKLFDANPEFIRAFAGTGVSMVVTVPNGDIPGVAKLPAARDWVAAHIAPFYPATNISLLAVGNEVLATSDKNLIAHLLPAMRSLTAALAQAGMGKIRVTTPHSLGILSASEPPSTGRFRRGYDRAIFAPMLQFHRQTKTPFMVNPYPYFGYTARTLNYAIFKPNGGIFDAATGINYTNMFVAQMDAVHSAMKRLGYGDVEIAVGETGWPSAGDAGQPELSVENAASYNGNLIREVNSGRGTPLMPGRRFETYIFSLFNENQKPGPTAERNFGLFRADLTPVYDVGLARTRVRRFSSPLLVVHFNARFHHRHLLKKLHRRGDRCGPGGAVVVVGARLLRRRCRSHSPDKDGVRLTVESRRPSVVPPRFPVGGGRACFLRLTALRSPPSSFFLLPDLFSCRRRRRRRGGEGGACPGAGPARRRCRRT